MPVLKRYLNLVPCSTEIGTSWGGESQAPAVPWELPSVNYLTAWEEDFSRHISMKSQPLLLKTDSTNYKGRAGRGRSTYGSFLLPQRTYYVGICLRLVRACPRATQLLWPKHSSYVFSVFCAPHTQPAPLPVSGQDIYSECEQPLLLLLRVRGKGSPCHEPQLSLWSKRFETQGIYRYSSVPIWKILSKMSCNVTQNRKLLSRMHQRVNSFLYMYTYFFCLKENIVKIRPDIYSELKNWQFPGTGCT